MIQWPFFFINVCGVIVLWIFFASLLLVFSGLRIIYGRFGISTTIEVINDLFGSTKVYENKRNVKIPSNVIVFTPSICK